METAQEVRGMLDKQRLTTFVLGGIAGALAGILLAPKSGKEFRGSITSRAGEARERGRETYFEAQERMQERLAESREHPQGPERPPPSRPKTCSDRRPRRSPCSVTSRQRERHRVRRRSGMYRGTRPARRPARNPTRRRSGGRSRRPARVCGRGWTPLPNLKILPAAAMRKIGCYARRKRGLESPVTSPSGQVGV